MRESESEVETTEGVCSDAVLTSAWRSISRRTHVGVGEKENGSGGGSDAMIVAGGPVPKFGYAVVVSLIK